MKTKHYTGIIYKAQAGRLVYYGQTTKTLDERKTEHYKTALKGTNRERLFYSVLLHKKFIFSIVGHYPVEQLNEKEKHYIEKARKNKKVVCLNTTKGGEQTRKPQPVLLYTIDKKTGVPGRLFTCQDVRHAAQVITLNVEKGNESTIYNNLVKVLQTKEKGLSYDGRRHYTVKGFTISKL